MTDISILGCSNAARRQVNFGIEQSDRLSHLYIIGKTGTGKSTLIRNLIMQDLRAGRGCCLIDPHGDLVEFVYANAPEERRVDI